MDVCPENRSKIVAIKYMHYLDNFQNSIRLIDNRIVTRRADDKWSIVYSPVFRGIRGGWSPIPDASMQLYIERIETLDEPLERPYAEY